MSEMNDKDTEVVAEMDSQLGNRLVVISVDQDLSLTLEENPFPAYIVSGIADWLALWAEAEMTAEMVEDDEE